MEKTHKAALDGPKESITAIEDQLQTMLKEDQQIRTNYQLVLTVPGADRLTALSIIGCTNNFLTKISGKQLASYTGVVPIEHKSGTRVKGRNHVRKMASKELKCMLHLCALAAIRSYPWLKHYLDRKKGGGKHSISVLNAIKNKIALRVVAVIGEQKPCATIFLQAA